MSTTSPKRTRKSSTAADSGIVTHAGSIISKLHVRRGTENSDKVHVSAIISQAEFQAIRHLITKTAK